MDEQRILETIRHNVRVLVPEIGLETITLDQSLLDLGLNSIDRLDVIVLTMEELAITVPVHEFHRGDTIGGLVRVMRRYA